MRSVTKHTEVCGKVGSMKKIKEIYRQWWCEILIMLLAIGSRVVGLGTYPGGVNVDEAFAGYEAWAMLQYGTDSWGYHNPVYLTVWGSGMSVLNSVLMMPFIKIWGLNTVTIRIPQMLTGVLSVYVFYCLLKRIADRKLALTGMFLMAVCPWHIMMSRWGIDCNLAPGFLLFAVFFFIKGLEKEKYLLLSALFWGLSLYCYATIWILVPCLLAVWGIYCLIYKKMKISKITVLSLGILLLLAVPLLLFVAVNIGWIPEIRTAFLSVPRLVEFRADEVGKANIINNIRGLIRLFVRQDDGLLWNAIPYFGMFYLFSMPFIIWGGIRFLMKAIRKTKEKKFSYEMLFLLWILFAFFFGIVQGVNINKINNVHIPVLVLLTEGVDRIIRSKKRFFSKGIICLYALSFICFQGYYFTIYQEQISERQLAGAKQAVTEALRLKEQKDYEKIRVPDALRHSQILFFTAWSPEDYRETVQWQEYPARWLKTSSFGCFVWENEEQTDEEPEEDMIYLITKEEKEKMETAGWNVTMYEYVGVAYK